MKKEEETGLFYEPQEGETLGPIMTLLKEYSESPGYARLPKDGPDTEFFEINFCDNKGVLRNGLILEVKETRKPYWFEDRLTLICNIVVALPRVRYYTLVKELIVGKGQEVDWDRIHCSYSLP